MTTFPAVTGTKRSSKRRVHDVRFRAIRPDDWGKLQRFHARLSPSTVQHRFHGSKRELSVPLAHTFTDVDGVHDAAIVATTGTRGRIVGVARYCRITPTSAEVAFVVDDAYQRQGIGGRLMCHLRDLAMANGVTVFVAEVLSDNIPMFRLLERLGTTRRLYDRGSCEVEVDLIAPG
jgi:RimJ/RimL family protein N-acetyltransferase